MAESPTESHYEVTKGLEINLNFDDFLAKECNEMKEFLMKVEESAKCHYIEQMTAEGCKPSVKPSDVQTISTLVNMPGGENENQAIIGPKELKQIFLLFLMAPLEFTDDSELPLWEMENFIFSVKKTHPIHNELKKELDPYILDGKKMKITNAERLPRKLIEDINSKIPHSALSDSAFVHRPKTKTGLKMELYQDVIDKFKDGTKGTLKCDFEESDLEGSENKDYIFRNVKYIRSYDQDYAMRQEECENVLKMFENKFGDAGQIITGFHRVHNREQIRQTLQASVTKQKAESAWQTYVIFNGHGTLLNLMKSYDAIDQESLDQECLIAKMKGFKITDKEPPGETGIMVMNENCITFGCAICEVNNFDQALDRSGGRCLRQVKFFGAHCYSYLMPEQAPLDTKIHVQGMCRMKDDGSEYIRETISFTGYKDHLQQHLREMYCVDSMIFNEKENVCEVTVVHLEMTINADKEIKENIESKGASDDPSLTLASDGTIDA